MKTLNCEICSMAVEYAPRPGLTSVPCWYCPNLVEIPAEAVIPSARRVSRPRPVVGGARLVAAPAPPRPKDCPGCGLVNNTNAVTCDCGYAVNHAHRRPAPMNARDKFLASASLLVAACALVRFLVAISQYLFGG